VEVLHNTHFFLLKQQIQLARCMSPPVFHKLKIVPTVNFQTEAMEMQHRFQRELREEREKLALRDEESRMTARALEEARAAELERISQRESDRRNAEDELHRERAALAVRAEKVAALEARLGVQKKELDQRSDVMKESESTLQERKEEILRMEKDAKNLLEVKQTLTNFFCHESQWVAQLV